MPFESPKKIEQQEKIPQWTVQQRVLGSAILTGEEKATISYQLEGSSRHMTHQITEKEIPQVIKRIKADPKDAQAMCRINLMAIARDPRRQSPQKIKDRLERYLKAYINLIINADKINFPEGEKIYHDVPAYIPDGLSDMGGSKEIDPQKRSREKIRVNKAKVYEQAKDLLTDIFTKNLTKQEIVHEVAKYVYTQMHYDYKGDALFEEQKGRSVGVHEYMEQRLGVCRHQAMYTQLLLQLAGITSRLMKCHINGGRHACNLVRINNIWHLLDVTNPEEFPDGATKIYLKKLPEKDIDLNAKTYFWTLPCADHTRKYQNLISMNYRIRRDEIK